MKNTKTQKPIIFIVGTLDASVSAIAKIFIDQGLVEDNTTFQAIWNKVTPLGTTPRYLKRLTPEQTQSVRSLAKVVELWRDYQDKRIALVNVPCVGVLFGLARLKLRPIDTVIHYQRETLKYYKDSWRVIEHTDTFRKIDDFFAYLLSVERMTENWITHCNAEVISVNGDKFFGRADNEVKYNGYVTKTLKGILDIHRQFNRG
jgi:hypothetical protein